MLVKKNLYTTVTLLFIDCLLLLSASIFKFFKGVTNLCNAQKATLVAQRMKKRKIIYICNKIIFFTMQGTHMYKNNN